MSWPSSLHTPMLSKEHIAQGIQGPALWMGWLFSLFFLLFSLAGSPTIRLVTERKGDEDVLKCFLRQCLHIKRAFDTNGVSSYHRSYEAHSKNVMEKTQIMNHSGRCKGSLPFSFFCSFAISREKNGWEMRARSKGILQEGEGAIVRRRKRRTKIRRRAWTKAVYL